MEQAAVERGVVVTSGPTQTMAAPSDPAAALEAQRRRLEAALATRPDHAASWNNLGVTYRQLGRLELAEACYRRALAIAPKFDAAIGNLGNILKDLGCYPESLEAHWQIVGRHAEDARAWHNLGLVFNTLGRSQEAIGAFDRALELAPELKAIGFDRAIARLRGGDYGLGWEDFEARWFMPRARPRGLDRPLWGGEPLDGRRILIHCEQGFGDNILTARFLPLVKARGGTVIVECRAELARLFRSLESIDELIIEGEPLPDYDLYCPTMSLPRAFGVRLEAVPASIPFTCPPSAMAKAQQLLPPGSDRLRIGIVWSGSVTFEGNQQRAARLVDFLKLYAVPGIELFSLQKAEPRQELQALGASALVTDLADHLTDFADTAAVLGQLDLIVMTDSAVAHLAATQGCPVWNLLQPVPYWLYGLDGERTPWYPEMRLFRQRTHGEWSAVFENVCTALEAFRRAHRARRESSLRGRA